MDPSTEGVVGATIDSEKCRLSDRIPVTAKPWMGDGAAPQQPESVVQTTEIAARVDRLMGVIQTLQPDDQPASSVADRLSQVDLIQEQILEHLDELNLLLQWQVERLVNQRPGLDRPLAAA